MDSSTNPARVGVNAAIMEGSKGFVTSARSVMRQPGVRRAIPAIFIVTAAAIGLLAYTLLGVAPHTTIYSGLPEAEKARAIEVLAGSGIEATIDQTTGELQVKSTDYHKARMALASEGLPQEQPDGYALINDMTMGTSRAVEQARLRQMQELELAKSITELQPVKAARVHLALPERTAFVRETQPPRASVFVQLQSGMMLDEGQVASIVSLVSASVPGMPRSQVSVIDQTGRLLTRPVEDPTQIINDQQMQYRMRMEELYRNRINELITPIVGVGNVAVQVTLDLDFTRTEITSEEYAPDQAALRSEQRQLQENTNIVNGGIPGAVTNSPPTEATLTQEGPTTAAQNNVGSRSSSSTKNYEVSRRVETRTPTSVNIKRVNAAVLVRATELSSALPADDAAPIQVGLPPEVVADIERLVKSAVSFDEGRGDVVTVSSQPFVDAFEAPTREWYNDPWIQDSVRLGAQLLGLGIVVMGVIRPILTRVLQAGSAANIVGAGYADAIEVSEGDSLQDLRDRLGVEDENIDFDGAQEYDAKVNLIKHLAETDGSRIATLFENMIYADKEK